MSYSEAHRALLTYVRAKKVTPADSLAAQFERIAAHYDVPPSVRDAVATINVKLEPFGFKIDSTWDQHLGLPLYVFVNTRFDDIIQNCTPYSPPELEAIKGLVDSIVSAHDYVYSYPMGNARQQVAATANKTTSDAAHVLVRLIDDGWLETTGHNRVVLAPAALAELRAYLVDRFGVFSRADPQGKLLACHVCRALVTVGAKCVDRACPVAFHDRCMVLFRRSADACPECQAALGDARAVGAGHQ